MGRAFPISRNRNDHSPDNRHASRVSAWAQARAIALLPGVVAVLVPAFLLLSTGANVGWGLGSPVAALPVLLGLVLIALGFALRLWTVRGGPVRLASAADLACGVPRDQPRLLPAPRGAGTGAPLR